MREVLMKIREKSDERALGYIATACYAFSLAICGLAAYAFALLMLAAVGDAGETLYYTGMRF
jgi:hypothetical protein